MFDTLTDGDVLLADLAYDSDGLRTEMAAHGVWANVRAMSQRIKPPAFSSYLYKLRKLAAARIWMRFMKR